KRTRQRPDAGPAWTCSGSGIAPQEALLAQRGKLGVGGPRRLQVAVPDVQEEKQALQVVLGNPDTVIVDTGVNGHPGRGGVIHRLQDADAPGALDDAPAVPLAQT